MSYFSGFASGLSNMAPMMMAGMKKPGGAPDLRGKMIDTGDPFQDAFNSGMVSPPQQQGMGMDPAMMMMFSRLFGGR